MQWHRTSQGVLVGALIVAFIIAVLILAQAGVDDVHLAAGSKRCAQSIWQSQWPRWLGCAMAQHESLAGGLLGAGGVLFAAWLAYSGIQEQIRAERRRNLQNEQRETL